MDGVSVGRRRRFCSDLFVGGYVLWVCVVMWIWGFGDLGSEQNSGNRGEGKEKEGSGVVESNAAYLWKFVIGSERRCI